MKALTWQLSKYTVVAGGSAISDWVTFVFLMWIGFPPIFAQMAARVVGGLFSFLSNRGWSFKVSVDGAVLVQSRRFALLYVASYTLSVTLFYLAVHILDFAPYIAKLCIDSFCFLFNFTVMRIYVFKSRSGLLALLISRSNRIAEPTKSQRPPV